MELVVESTAAAVSLTPAPAVPGYEQVLGGNLEPNGAELIGTYTGNFREGIGVISKNSYGKGTAYYLGTGLEPDSLKTLLKRVVEEGGVAGCRSRSQRVWKCLCGKYNHQNLYCIFNFCKEPAAVELERAYYDACGRCCRWAGGTAAERVSVLIGGGMGLMKQALILTGGEVGRRIEFGISLLEQGLAQAGYDVRRETLMISSTATAVSTATRFTLAAEADPFIAWLEEQEVLLYHGPEPGKEGFYLESCPGRLTVVVGGDDTGTVYGCRELAGRIAREGSLPTNLAFYDAPAFKLRGPCLGLQKTKIEPPRLTYEYPITPDRFPWFYDKELWRVFLDRMVDYRCNVLYLWSGHPFSSLVKLEEYPEALEVSEEEYELNRAMFRWLTEECDRRGIWVVLKFYNIHIPYPFAVKHGLEQRQARIHPLVADYTAKSIVEFNKSFPNIGLMVCLGEALRGYDNKTEWFVKTIIPAVKEGMRQAGIGEEPPIILRAHDCDPFAAIAGAEELYSNLYTMWKYNGESLTTYYPRGSWQRQHKALSGMKSTHIINVHVLANLEPFRYNAVNFIQKSMQAAKYRLGGNGLHLYPSSIGTGLTLRTRLNRECCSWTGLDVVRSLVPLCLEPGTG